MKKIVIVLLALSLVLSTFAMTIISSSAEEESRYVRFTATGNDPYASLTFSKAGNNSAIDPDIVTWAAIRYRVNNPVDSTGVEYTGQFYITPAAEPCVPIKWNVDGQWNTIIVDLTAVSAKATLDSIWNSDSYTGKQKIRFDPLEPDRDAEAKQTDGAQVNAGDSLDVAWMAFFTSEDDAKAYTGKEKTPYCIIDIDSMANPEGGNRLEADKYIDGVVDRSGVLKETVIVSRGSASSPYKFNDHEVAFKTPVVPDGNVIRVFSMSACPTWNKIESGAIAEAYVWKGDYDSSYVGKPIATVEVLNHTDNGALKFDFGNKLRYGKEYLIVVTSYDESDIGYWDGALGEYEGWTFFLDAEELDPTATAVSPLSVYYVEVGELPEETEEPTEVPTDTPAPTDTPDPTDTPAPATDAPKATDAPEATDAPKDEEKKSGCGSIIGGALSIITIGAATMFICRKKH